MGGRAKFYKWLHDAGYTFNGHANMSGLLPEEITMLQLGFVIEQDQAQEQRRQTNDPHATHSDSYGARKRALANKYKAN